MFSPLFIASLAIVLTGSLMLRYRRKKAGYLLVFSGLAANQAEAVTSGHGSIGLAIFYVALMAGLVIYHEILRKDGPSLKRDWRKEVRNGALALMIVAWFVRIDQLLPPVLAWTIVFALFGTAVYAQSLISKAERESVD